MEKEKIVVETKTEEGTKVIVQEDLTKKRDNPLVELVATGAKGEQPTNVQIEKMFHTTKEILEEEKKSGLLTPEGRVLVEDTEKLIEASERFLEQKNPDELLQKMVKEGQQAMKEVSEGIKYGQIPKFSSSQITQIQKDAQKLYENARDLILALIRSGELRDMLADGIEIFQSLLEAEKKGVKQGGSEKQWAEKQQWTGQQQWTQQPQWTEQKQWTGQQQQTAWQQQQQPMWQSQQQQPLWKQQQQPTTPSTFGTTQTAKPSTQTFGQQPMETEKPNLEKLKQGKVESTGQVFEAVAEAANIPPEEREKLRKETQEKFLNWLARLGSKPEYKTAIRNILSIFDSMKSRAQMFKEELPSWEDIPGGVNFEAALKDAKRILARFVGRLPLRRFQDSFEELWNDVLYNDTELRALLSKFKNYLLEVTENPELLKNEMKREEGKQYLDRLREQTQKQNYRKRLDDLYYNLNVMLEHVQNDATTKDFQIRLEKFTKDFVMNKEGKPDVWVLGNSVDQLRVMMGPILKKYLENIPIDRIDIISDNYDLRIEDVKISGADILPHYMDFRMDNKAHLDLKDTDLNVSKARLVAYIHHIKPHFKDVKFQYKRKSFPKIDDYGMCNLSFTGDGASLKLVWEIRSVPGKPTTAVLLENRCRIDSISIEINSSQTKHSLLDRMMAVLLQQRIKHEICRSVEDYLNNNIGVVNDQINSFFTQNPWEAVKEKATKQIFETIKQLPLNV